MTERRLAGKRVLVVEDEALLAMELRDLLEEHGAEVVGPAATLERGLALAHGGDVDLALLDLNLNGERSNPIAEALDRRGVPVAFITGNTRLELPSTHQGGTIVHKPFQEETLVETLARLTA